MMNANTIAKDFASEHGGSKIGRKEELLEWSAYIGAALERLEEGEKLNLKYVGTFKKVLKKARKGYDCSRGKIIEIPAKKVIVFKPDPQLEIE